jgi:hypothetical protein
VHLAIRSDRGGASTIRGEVDSVPVENLLIGRDIRCQGGNNVEVSIPDKACGTVPGGKQGRGRWERGVGVSISAHRLDLLPPELEDKTFTCSRLNLYSTGTLRCRIPPPAPRGSRHGCQWSKSRPQALRRDSVVPAVVRDLFRQAKRLSGLPRFAVRLLSK